MSDLPCNLRIAVDDHMINYPASDLRDILTGRKTFQDAFHASGKIPPQRATEAGSEYRRKVAG
jgi:hypothetical protein